MNGLQHIGNWPIISALCWTLLHSLWQALIAVILAAFMRSATINAKPLLRFRLLSGLLVVFILLSSSTFLYEYRMYAHSSYGTDRPHLPTGGALLSVFICHHTTVLFVCWSCGLIFHAVRAGFGLAYTRYIISRQGCPAPGIWQLRLKQLASKLEVSRSIRLLESGLIKLPLVFGHLKPVILLPAGLLTGLPPEQIDAILLHELAHIRRNDYLVNLMQQFIDTFFYFNPALRWLSAMVRDERENCCDELALEADCTPRDYVAALVNFQEFALRQPMHRLPFTGHGSGLVGRMRRILYRRNAMPSATEKWLLSAGCLVALTFLIMGAPVPHQTSGAARGRLAVVDSSRVVPAPTVLDADHISPASMAKTQKRHKPVRQTRDSRQQSEQMPARQVSDQDPLLRDKDQQLRDKEQLLRDRAQLRLDQRQLARDKGTSP